MGNLEPIDPILESPLAIPIIKQKSVACDLMSDIAAGNCVKEGILLSTIEKDSKLKKWPIKLQETKLVFSFECWIRLPYSC